MVKIYGDKCPQNHKCPIMRLCPKKSVKQEGFNVPTVDRNTCIECNICVKNCPYNVFEEE